MLLLEDDRARPQVDACIRQLGLGGRVRRVKGGSEDQRAACLGAADLFVYCPTQESWGTEVCEAMACGLPVVASTSVGASADLVIPGRTGMLVPPGGAQELGRAISEVSDLVRTPALRERMQRHSEWFEASGGAARLAALVGRLATCPARSDFSPLLDLAIGEVRNSWGKWQQ